MAKLSSYLPLALSLSVTLLILRPILGNVWYPMHDSTHVSRLFLMEQTIQGGQFPPIWAEGINNGYGYPLFHFYAPLFYYVALVGKLIAGTYIGGIKIALVLFLTAGGYGIYMLVKRWGTGAGILALCAFLLSPYLAVNLYVRGAYAEITALSLLPWVVVTWENLSTRRKELAAAVAMALFLVSHNLIPLVAFPIIAVWVVIVNRRYPTRLILPSILTLTLAAGYLLPLFFERSFVQADQVARTTEYALHFVYPWQLWNSTWGFGGSAWGVEDGLSFKVGKLQLLLAGVGLLFALFHRRYRIILWACAAIFSLGMATTLAQPVWDALPVLGVIQFPWRYLGVAAIFVAALAGTATTAVPIKMIRGAVTIGCCIALLALNLKLFRPATIMVADDTIFTRPEYLATVSHIIPEFMPRWMKEVPLEPPKEKWERAYYPTWTATLGGKNIVLNPDENGVIEYPDGIEQSHIVLTQSHTPLEKWGYALTIISLCTIIWLGRKK